MKSSWAENYAKKKKKKTHIGRLVLNYLKNNKQMQITYTIN